MLNEQAIEFLKGKLNEKEIFKYVDINLALPTNVTEELKGLLPEIKEGELYDTLVFVRDDEFLVQPLLLDQPNYDEFFIPRTIQLH